MVVDAANEFGIDVYRTIANRPFCRVGCLNGIPLPTYYNLSKLRDVYGVNRRSEREFVLDQYVRVILPSARKDSIQDKIVIRYRGTDFIEIYPEGCYQLTLRTPLTEGQACTFKTLFASYRSVEIRRAPKGFCFRDACDKWWKRRYVFADRGGYAVSFTPDRFHEDCTTQELIAKLSNTAWQDLWQPGDILLIPEHIVFSKERK